MKRHFLFFTALCATLATGVFAGEGHHQKTALLTEDGKAMLAEKIANIKNTPWDGILVEGLFTDNDVQVSQVQANSPGEKAGIQVGDILVAMNGDKISGMSKDTFYAAMNELSFGQNVVYKIKRGDDYTKVKVTMAQMPADVAAQTIGYAVMKYIEWDQSEGQELAATN